MNNLKQIRESQGLRKEDLAALSGLSWRTIEEIEKGSYPNGQTIKSLTTALKVTAVEIFPWIDGEVADNAA